MKRYRCIPYGYCMAEGELSVQPEEHSVITGIFEQYLQGVSPAKLAERLNTKGIRFSESEPNWNKGRIYRILADSRYTGAGQYPKLIEESTMRAVKEKIEQNSTYKTPCDTLARGVGEMLRCGCGERLKRNPTMRWVCPGCGAAITSVVLERKLTAIMKRLVDAPDEAERRPSAQYEPTGEIMRLSSDIRRTINNKDFDAAELRAKVLQCASLKYGALQSDATPCIKGTIQRITAESLQSAEEVTKAVRKIAEEIAVEEAGEIRVRLKNGTIIRTIEEDSNGSCGE